MSDYENKGYELDWDSEIENEGSDFIVAEPGDYDFVVTNFERGRFQGSAKMPPCNQAKLTIRLEIPGCEGICFHLGSFIRRGAWGYSAAPFCCHPAVLAGRPGGPHRQSACCGRTPFPRQYSAAFHRSKAR